MQVYGGFIGCVKLKPKKMFRNSLPLFLNSKQNNLMLWFIMI